MTISRNESWVAGVRRTMRFAFGAAVFRCRGAAGGPPPSPTIPPRQRWRSSESPGCQPLWMSLWWTASLIWTGWIIPRTATCPPARPSLGVGRLFQILALAVPMLAVLVLSDATPAQAQTNPRPPSKPVLTLRPWPHPHEKKVIVSGGQLIVLTHWELSWPKLDAGGLLLHYQFAAGEPEHIEIPPDTFSNINDEGEIYNYVRVIGPRDGVRTIQMRGRNYLANDCEGTGPCEGAGEWSDHPLVVRPDPPGLPLGQVEAPTITGSPALSEAGEDGAWTADETVEVTLTFSEAVTVDTTGGTPSIAGASGSIWAGPNRDARRICGEVARRSSSSATRSPRRTARTPRCWCRSTASP